MGDRAWACLTLYQVGGPKEVEALCAFIEEHLSAGYGDQPVTELVVWGDYTVDETSLGFTDEADSLAEDTPNSIWTLTQAGYSGAGTVAYHLPGLGVWHGSEDGETVFSRAEVKMMFTMTSAARDKALGTPWIETCEALAKWLNALPAEQRRGLAHARADAHGQGRCHHP
jgi:hypothetical protein